MSFFVLGVLDLHCCEGFSNCKEWGICPSCSVRAAPRSGFWGCKAQTLEHISIITAHGLCCFAACGILLIRDQTHVYCTGRQVLYYWTAREAPIIRLHSKWIDFLYFLLFFIIVSAILVPLPYLKIVIVLFISIKYLAGVFLKTSWKVNFCFILREIDICNVLCFLIIEHNKPLYSFWSLIFFIITLNFSI